MNFHSPGSQTIPSVVGPPHDMYSGMHAAADHTMGHVSSGMVHEKTDWMWGLWLKSDSNFLYHR